MQTSLLRRTVDPIIAATVATLMCAVAANSQIVVSQESGENPSLSTKLRGNERFVPDVVLYDTAAPVKIARPKVDSNIINKMVKAREHTSSTKSFASLPGHGVQ